MVKKILWHAKCVTNPQAVSCVGQLLAVPLRSCVIASLQPFGFDHSSAAQSSKECATDLFCCEADMS